MPEFIFNTTTLSNFAAVNRLDLLTNRYQGRAFTTLEVGDELRRGLQAGYTYLDPVCRQLSHLNPAGWLVTLVPETEQEHRLRAEFDDRLDIGEASCLALAVTRGLTFITDDRAARQLAQAHAVPLTGTLGILLALVRDDVLPLANANQLLAEMIRQRYRSPITRLDDLL